MRPIALVLLAGCAAEPITDSDTDVGTAAVSLAFTREHVTGDIYHYEVTVPIGDAPNAALRIHRVVREAAPFVPRPTRAGAMLLHGDFSTFTTNFMPGMAPYLAAHDLDVWGLDRRWAIATDDVSDFADIGVQRELDDLRGALAIARGLHGGRLALVGFSHGGQLAYAYTAVEAAQPPAQRHVSALAPLDFYGDFAPEDAGLRAATCEASAFEYQLVADGVTDAPNDFLIGVGELALTDPDGASPFFDGLTNRGALLVTVGQTYLFAPFAPFYHLAAPILDGDTAVGLAESPEPVIATWLARSTPHQAMREAADLDALLCGDAPPVAAPLSAIRVPVFYLGAAGGVGSLGLHAAHATSSSDVTTLVVQRFGPERRAEDFGHADLLYATDAPALAWQPLAAWLVQQ